MMTMFETLFLRKKIGLVLIVLCICPCLWIFYKTPAHPLLWSTPTTQPHKPDLHQNSSASSGGNEVIPSSLPKLMAERRQLLREQCLTKPPNPNFIKEADFTRFIVIEKLKFVFCFIPKISCTTWKGLLYRANNGGKRLPNPVNPHDRSLFSWLIDYSVDERKEILNSYYKAMFVREPFARLASAYRSKRNTTWLKRFIISNKTTEQLKKEAPASFSTFIKNVLTSNQTTIRQRGYIEDQHWRSYEQICPCEVNYDFIGHFENLAEEAPQLLKTIGIDDYVTFPEYRPSKTTPYMIDYYSQLTNDEINQLGKLYELDFKLYGYDFPGPLEEVLRMRAIAKEK